MKKNEEQRKQFNDLQLALLHISCALKSLQAPCVQRLEGIDSKYCEQRQRATWWTQRLLDEVKQDIKKLEEL